MRDILGIVFRISALFLLVPRLFAQNADEATHRFEYPAEHFSIELPAGAKEIDAKTASLVGSMTGQLIPNAPSFHLSHIYTSSDLSTQGVAVMLTENRLTDAAFKDLENIKKAVNNFVQGMIGGSALQSAAAEDISYDKEHHVAWLNVAATSLLAGHIRAISGVYLTRVGTIQAQCYAKEAEFSRYEEECKRIIHSVVIDPNVVLLPPPPLSQLLGITAAEADATYRDLTARVKAGDFTVDFRTLRMACAKSSVCAPRATPGDLGLMNLSVSERRFSDAMEMANRLLDEGYINMEAHIALVQAYKELKQPEQAQFHTKVVTALLQSIVTAGDGKSTATAYEVMSFREELIVLGGKGWPPSSHSESFTEGGHRYEKRTRQNPNTLTEDVIFFNIDAVRK